MIALRAAAVIALVLGLVSGAGAKTLFGVISERSAAGAAAAAERHLDAQPADEIILRTEAQVRSMDEQTLARHWRAADAVLLGAVFEDAVVGRLLRLAREAPPSRLLAVSGDRRLTRSSRLDESRPLAGLETETIDQLTGNPAADEDPVTHRERLAADHPDQALWLTGLAYWQGRSPENLAALFAWLLGREAPPPQPRAPLRLYHDGAVVAAGELSLDPERPVVAVLDHDTGDRLGDRALLDSVCDALAERDLQCLVLLARWGEASVAALERLSRLTGKAPLAALVSLQGFVIGGGDGRAEATAALQALDVPVLQGIRLDERTRDQWRLSADGIPADDVHWRVAMPELQGVSQPMVLAHSTEARVHEATGLRVAVTEPDAERVERLTGRLARWSALRRKPNADKRIAIVFYNHPPGRQNLGADNLDVPASLLRILRDLDAAGYDVGELPADVGALTDRLLARGVNLPEDAAALAGMAAEVPGMPADTYREWLDSQPASVRRELRAGPLGRLHQRLRDARRAGEPGLADDLRRAVLGDLRALLRELDHPGRDRAAELLERLDDLYQAHRPDWQVAASLIEAIRGTGVPGLGGWGEPPGRVMVHDGRFVFPGLTFGNVFIGPQPPRGWHEGEEALHANLGMPPPHQYLAFYHWLRDGFAADAVVHLGRHSTYEFLPHRRAGLAPDDYPDLVAGDLPGIYPYIVDGVGEGLQAKRRGLAVIVDHLTPPLRTTPLYDDLLGLRQLVESWEAGAAGGAARERAFRRLRERLDALDLRGELETAIAEEFGWPEARLDELEPELVVHEVGHYLTELQEQFMPSGLHVFGADWTQADRGLMLESMAGDGEPEPHWGEALAASPAAEREALLGGLDGRFVRPGEGSDPVRNPDVLPTGRNFHALDGSLLPTRVGYELGAEMAAEARARGGSGSEAVVLWASDTVRDEGAMVGFGLSLLGVAPEWNSRGIVSGLRRVPLANDATRRDVVFTTSGLFRDLYGNLLELVDRAVRLALQGSAATIRARHPALVPALEAALAPLDGTGEAGSEPLERNRLAAHWVADARAALAAGEPPAAAGREAVRRVFGDAPGSYGAGINTLAERSGAWEARGELGEAYLGRLGHAYGADAYGEPAGEAFRGALERVRRSYLGRASHLYGLLDNNDAFDYLGGLGLAVETLTGEPPRGRIVDLSDPQAPALRPLETALGQELRGRYLNPAWIEPLLAHGYAGARTFGTGFLENLWGWQVTSPELVGASAWEAVDRVYFQDAHGLGVDEFLDRKRHAAVGLQMRAVLLVAAERGFWEPGEARLEALSRELAEGIIEHGLPGSGHTAPDHPMLKAVAERLDAATREAFEAELASARGEPYAEATTLTTVTEIAPLQEERPDAAGGQPPARRDGRSTAAGEPEHGGEPFAAVGAWRWTAAGLVVVLLAGGAWRGARAAG
ncbi:cobaltochelatase subunit CobN [Spiribacter halobius]|nr:cobaltochelatase subunit CobN [Spiribacter halobius]UEX77595.1 cobaltochelatase subunit CobN [Spiribacter halobius]